MKTRLGLVDYHFMRADLAKAHAIAIARQAAAILADAVNPMRQIQLQWAVGKILFHQGEFLPPP